MTKWFATFLCWLCLAAGSWAWLPPRAPNYYGPWEFRAHSTLNANALIFERIWLYRDGTAWQPATARTAHWTLEASVITIRWDDGYEIDWMLMTSTDYAFVHGYHRDQYFYGEAVR